MLNIQKLSISLLFLSLSSIALGQEVQNDSITCPEDISFLSFDKASCKNTNYTQRITQSPDSPSSFMKEVKRFNDQTITPIYRDNPSHSDDLIATGMRDLRKHQQCLRNICQIIFDQCSSATGNIWGTSQALNQQRECTNTVGQIMKIEQEKLRMAIYLNKSRKSQEVVHQQTTALLARVRRNLTPAFTDISRQLSRMVSKVNLLIKNPTTPGNTGSN